MDENITPRDDTQSIDDLDESLRIATERSDSNPEPEVAPGQIDEFAIRDILGRGGFGVVYSAFDNNLHREVAIKIPHRSLLNYPGAANFYLREARAIASLDHPHIIPVYRASRTDDVRVYIVTKLIRGCDLSQWLRRRRPSFEQIISILATVADALSYAHSRGVVHRDIKPGNILIDEDSQPFVADFGLALRDIEPQRSNAYAGTPAYMSPEQARGEGHRVDGRSDIFSLGCVMYVMLTGERPFRANDRRGLFDEIIYRDPPMPQELNPNVPSDLARICMKALSKRTANRYQSADAMSIDLRSASLHTRTSSNSESNNTDRPAVVGEQSEASDGDSIRSVRAPVVPKGLRSFDMRDSEFYLRLLPGPYDREGIPEIVRFWLTRTQLGQSMASPPIGLIYGPSGCGKTSLVRAGIMPRMAPDTKVIYVQASSEKTETELLDRLSLVVPWVAAERTIHSPPGSSDAAKPSRITVPTSVPATQPPQEENGAVEGDVSFRGKLVGCFAEIRRAERERVVIFIDQFEQWLFAHPDCMRAEMTEALRQCDGEYLQCILMVRDDFWMGVTRLMQTLDLTISENINATSVDLFDLAHARTVMAEFGKSFGRLPDSTHQLSPNQSRFLDDAIAYLAIGGRVICVQLALLAEILKDRPWDRSTDILRDGGVSIGTHFLNETFDRENTSRRMQLHADGAHRVLKALLPEAGSRIKGGVLTEAELMQQSEYRDRQHFRDLIHILDRELHLITPADHTDEESLASDSSDSMIQPIGYQLTHDFLIAPIRQWIELRSRASKDGKARLRLEEFTELYRARPRIQSLPTILEYLSIRWHIKGIVRSESQQTMLGAAFRHHARHATMWLAAILLVFASGWWVYRFADQRNQDSLERASLERLLGAQLPEAIQLASDLRKSSYVTEEAMRIAQSDQQSMDDRVRAALVVSTIDPVSQSVLADYVLQAPAGEVVSLVQDYDFPFEKMRSRMLTVWKNPVTPDGQAIRAASVLANDPVGIEKFQEDAAVRRLVQLLVAEDPVWIRQWGDVMAPLSSTLAPHLEAFLRQPDRQEDALSATHLFCSVSGQDPHRLADQLATARPHELAILTERLATHGEAGKQSVEQALKKLDDSDQPRIDLRTPWGSPWWVIGDRRPLDRFDAPELDASVKQMLRDADAAIAEHAILIHRLQASQLDRLVSGLKSTGYRLAAITPYQQRDERLLFVLIVRDRIDATYCIDASAEELKTQNDQHRVDGFIPSDLASHQGRYSCVWIRPPEDSGVMDGDLYVDVPGNRHSEDGWGPLAERGLGLPRSSFVEIAEDGSEHISSIRWKSRHGLDYRDFWNRPEQEYRDTKRLSRGRLVVGSRVTESLQTSSDDAPGRTAVWWHNVPLEYVESDYMPRLDHRRFTEKLLKQGYYPASIHAAPIGNDTTAQYNSIWWRPYKKMDDIVELSNSQSNMRFALLMLGNPSFVVDDLSGNGGEACRGAAISKFSQLGLPVSWLFDRLANTKSNTTLRRSCAMAMSLYSPQMTSEELIKRASNALPDLFNRTSDPGLRSGIERLAQTWKINLEPDRNQIVDQEFLTILGDRLVVIDGPGTIWMGSKLNELGRDGRKEFETPIKLDRTFAIATKEVTTAQYRRYRPDHDYAPDYLTSDDCPVIGVSWFDAARYCRWLSEQEGVPESEMCYPPLDQIGPGMTLALNTIDRIGYRLPTSAEWEYSARGGAESGRWFGFDPDRLNEHAWTAANSGYKLHPIGRLLPNDYGVFDLLGNVMEWCHTRETGFDKLPSTEIEDPGRAEFTAYADTQFNTRGGAILYQPNDARASQVNSHLANSNRVYIGFRIARTVRD